jgi:trans-aconitate methyltransferase
MTRSPFERAEQYDAMLNRGIGLSGEDKFFFVAGRLRDLKGRLPPDFRPRRILDYGCGIGDSMPHIAETFPGAEIVGVDASEESLAHGRARFGPRGFSFGSTETFRENRAFDLCYVNGVFHHVPPHERLGIARKILAALVPGGYLALFENNPWNPGTRISMSRVPFDRGARTLTAGQTRRLLLEAGFAHCAPARFLFYFPRFLRLLRFAEPWLARVPLGAQYYVLGVRRS